MNLIKALEIGKDCGLETVGECIRNVHIHAMSMFSYSEVNKELSELSIDYKALQSCTNVCDVTLSEVVLSLLNNELVKISVNSYKKALDDIGYADKSIFLNKEDYEYQMLSAFNNGMTVGYGVDHEDIHRCEEEAIKEFAERMGFTRKSLK